MRLLPINVQNSYIKRTNNSSRPNLYKNVQACDTVDFGSVNLNALETKCSQFLKETENVSEFRTVFDNIIDFYHGNVVEIVSYDPKSHDILDSMGNALASLLGKYNSKPETNTKLLVKESLEAVERGIQKHYDESFELKCLKELK